MRRKSKATSLSYSFVAHGTVVLADWLQFDHTVSGLTVDHLSELPCSINKITYDRGGCTINYLLDSNFSNTSPLLYLCLISTFQSIRSWLYDQLPA